MMKRAGVNFLNRYLQSDKSVTQRDSPATYKERVAIDTQSSNANHSLPKKEKQEKEKQNGSFVQTTSSLPRINLHKANLHRFNLHKTNLCRDNMNIEKITALRHAIRNGHYDVNAYRLAIRILQQEKELFGL